MTKGFKSAISKIAQDTFNTGQNKFAAQFTQLRKNVANYLQRTSASEGYLVAEMVRSGREQTIALPDAVGPNAPDAADLAIIRAKEVKTIAKRRLKLQNSLKKGYATVYDQCSQEVRKSSRLRTTGRGHRGTNPSTSSSRRLSVFASDSMITNKRYLT